jgi:hypothetical protein
MHFQTMSSSFAFASSVGRQGELSYSFFEGFKKSSTSDRLVKSIGGNEGQGRVRPRASKVWVGG